MFTLNPNYALPETAAETHTPRVDYLGRDSKNRVGRFFSEKPKCIGKNQPISLIITIEIEACVYDSASDVCIYLYANAAPNMWTDPSGNMTLSDAVLVVSVFATISSITFGILAVNDAVDKASYGMLINAERAASPNAPAISSQEFYKPFRDAYNEAGEFGISELEGRYVYGLLFDSLGAGLEAARLLRLAKNADEAMMTPNELMAARRVMERAGYIWIEEAGRNGFLTGYWRRPPGNPNKLPSPSKYYQTFKDRVKELSGN